MIWWKQMCSPPLKSASCVLLQICLMSNAFVWYSLLFRCSIFICLLDICLLTVWLFYFLLFIFVPWIEKWSVSIESWDHHKVTDLKGHFGHKTLLFWLKVEWINILPTPHSIVILILWQYPASEHWTKLHSMIDNLRLVLHFSLSLPTKLSFKSEECIVHCGVKGVQLICSHDACMWLVNCHNSIELIDWYHWQTQLPSWRECFTGLEVDLFKDPFNPTAFGIWLCHLATVLMFIAGFLLDLLKGVQE